MHRSDNMKVAPRRRRRRRRKRRTLTITDLGFATDKNKRLYSQFIFPLSPLRWFGTGATLRGETTGWSRTPAGRSGAKAGEEEEDETDFDLNTWVSLVEHSYIRTARNYHNHANISSKAIYLALWQTQEQQWRAAIFPQKNLWQKRQQNWLY